MFKFIRRNTFEILLVGLVLVTHAYAVFAPANSLMNWFSSDDAFYYFKTAQNISEGYGVTFDRIGRTNGFHPLWMLVCIPIFALARYDLILPLRLLVVVASVLNAATGVVLYRFLSRSLSCPTAALVAITWVFLPRIHQVTTLLGMETGINAFFTIWLIERISALQANNEKELDSQLQAGNGPPLFQNQLWKVGIIAALVLLSRLDTVFLVAILGLWVVFRLPRLRILLLGDSLSILVIVFGGFLLRLGFDRYYSYSSAAVWMGLVMLLIKLPLYTAFRLYADSVWTIGWRGALRILLAVAAGWLLSAIVLLSLSQANLISSFPRAILLLDGPLSLLAVLGLRWGLGWLVRRELPVPLGDPLLQHWREWSANGLRYFVPVGVALVLFMLWSYTYTGTASPVSGQIKRWWGTIYTVYGRPVQTVPGLFGIGSLSRDEPWSLLVYIPKAATDYTTRIRGLPKDQERADRIYYRIFRRYAYGIALASLLLLAINWRKLQKEVRQLILLPWFVACLVQLTSYTLTGYVAVKEWYWVAQMFFVVTLVGLVLEGAFHLLRLLRLPQAVPWGVVVLLSLVVLFNFRARMLYLMPWKVKPEKQQAYLAGIRELESRTEPGSLIGSTGGGILGYFIQDRTIVNLDGLINSNEYFQLMKAGKGFQYLDRIGLNYVFGSNYMLVFSEPYVNMFKDRLEPLGDVAGSVLYRYRRGDQGPGTSANTTAGK